MELNTLSKKELLTVVKHYNKYITDGVNNNWNGDWQPVCLGEFLNNEYKEMKEQLFDKVKEFYNADDNKANEIVNFMVEIGEIIVENTLDDFLCEDIGEMKIIDKENKEYEFEKDFYNQGEIFKSYKNFFEGSLPCYVPELSNKIYTREDFMKLTNNPCVAFLLFELADWQHPESLLGDLIGNGELIECPECGAVNMLYDYEAEGLDVICDSCNKRFKYE